MKPEKRVTGGLVCAGISGQVIATLLAFAAPFAAGAELDSLLRVGVNAGDTGLRWGLSQADIQQLFSAEAKPGDAGKQQWALDVPAALGECQFVAHLYGSRKDGLLREVRMYGDSGPADACHARVSQRMTRLYAQQPLVTHTGWTSQPRDGVMHSGTSTSSSWETRSTCAGLSWSTGAGYPGPNVSVSLRSTGCGWDGKNITASVPDPASVPARDADSPWEALLRIGLSAPDPAIRWDTPLAELKRRFSANVSNDALRPPWTQLRLAVSDADCRYDATIGGREEGLFGSVRLEQTAGPAEACRERMTTQLTRLYGPRAAELDRAGWRLQRRAGGFTSGDIFAASWDARVACVSLTWYEGGDFPPGRTVLQIGAERGCGGELDGGLRDVTVIE